MARLNVNPTRMELSRLKQRLKTAVRGHKLLKDKSDEMIRQFMTYAKENKRLREEVENELNDVLSTFMLARAIGDEESIEEALSLPAKKMELKIDKHSVMGVDVPEISFDNGSGIELPYGFLGVTAELDNAVLKLSAISEKLLKLAEIEKTCDMLADEIEKNRRRVNALEYVMIPDTEETIKYITMKLDENERSNTIRLMKVKDMVNKKS